MTNAGPTTSQQMPDRGKSASKIGFFGMLAEGIGILLAVFIGFMFFVGDGRPDVVAWILFGFAALTTIDLLRRIVRAVRI